LESKGSHHHKLRRWHKLDVQSADTAAIATLVGYGLHVATTRIAGVIKNRTEITDDKMKEMYHNALKDQKQMREQYKHDIESREKQHKTELEAKEKELSELKAQHTEKTNTLKHEMTSESNRLKQKQALEISLHREELAAAKSELESLRHKIKELQQEIEHLKAHIAKLEAEREESKKAAEEFHTQIKHAEDQLNEQAHLKQERISELQSEYDHARKNAKHMEDELRSRARHLEDELKMSKKKALEEEERRRRMRRSGRWMKNVPWGEVGLMTGVLGAGAAAGLGVGKFAMKGRLLAKDGGGGAPPHALAQTRPPQPPEPPADSVYRFDNPFNQQMDRAFDVKPCPCDDTETWDWKWVIILILLVLLLVDCFVFRLSTYIRKKLGITDEERLAAIRSHVEAYAQDSHLDLMSIPIDDGETDQEVKVKTKVLDRIKEVGEVLAECESALTKYRAVASATAQETKAVKEQRLMLKDAIDNCLSSSLVPNDDGDDKKQQRVYAYKFLDSLTRSTFKDEQIGQVMAELKEEFKKEEATLDRKAEFPWTGNEFDEIHFYRTHLTHVETREGRTRTVSNPVVADADKKHVKDVAKGFENAAIDAGAAAAPMNPLIDDQQEEATSTSRARYSPAARLRKLFAKYMRAMKKDKTQDEY